MSDIPAISVFDQYNPAGRRGRAVIGLMQEACARYETIEPELQELLARRWPEMPVQVIARGRITAVQSSPALPSWETTYDAESFRGPSIKVKALKPANRQDGINIVPATVGTTCWMYFKHPTEYDTDYNSMVAFEVFEQIVLASCTPTDPGGGGGQPTLVPRPGPGVISGRSMSVGPSSSDWPLSRAAMAGMSPANELDWLATRAPILISPNGTKYRIDVDNAGALSTTAV